MESEFRAVRSELPQAYMGGFLSLPVAACLDKKDGASSFARSVAKLRRLTGRADVYAASEWHRPDFAAIVLYSCADEEAFTYGSKKELFEHSESIERGVARVSDIAAPLSAAWSPSGVDRIDCGVGFSDSETVRRIWRNGGDRMERSGAGVEIACARYPIPHPGSEVRFLRTDAPSQA